MKNLVGVFLFLSTICSGQFFESDGEFFESKSSQEYFQEYDDSNNQTFAFFQDSSSDYGYDYGEDGLTNPGEEEEPVPIDDWFFLLPIFALAIGSYFLVKKNQPTNSCA